MNDEQTITIDGRPVPIEGERNLLEMIRKSGIDIPTFCYHSELSVYGACRLCIVDIEGRGIVASCSQPPEPGLVVKTSTAEIREMRKMTIELLLADHDKSCPTCPKSAMCRMQDIARRLGVDKVRFDATRKPQTVDASSPSLVRDPNKCILCGDCVRLCAEIQGIGAIDFAHRGALAAVAPAFNKDLNAVECVYCGQCARVCPTGALTPKSEVDAVWKSLHDTKKKVVAQIAPAVRVAIGEAFGMPAGTVATGQIVTALRRMGFDKVFDTSFTADLTVIEEANEFLKRKLKGERLPQFTSCCPGWVKYAEQFYPGLLPNLSSCKSPQQMFGSLAKETLPQTFGIDRRDLVVVSIMPCTAKKAEAKLDKFNHEGAPDVDHVLTTQELARMIEEAGLDFVNLEPGSLDLPFGFKTGAGMIFGNSGGVTEAVLRYAVRQVTQKELENVEFHDVRGEDGLREASIAVGDITLKLAIVHGLANAQRVADRVRAGKSDYDLIEVMACPGGCVGGAGQPIPKHFGDRQQRTQGLYNADRMLDLHSAEANPYVSQQYKECMGEIGGPKAHELLHTHYKSRRRISGTSISLVAGKNVERLSVSVCLGTSCHVRGAGNLLQQLVKYVKDNGLEDYVDVKATFCYERCDRGPTVRIEDTVIEKCTLEKASEVLDREVEKLLDCYTPGEMRQVLKNIGDEPKDPRVSTLQDFERQVAAGLRRFLEKQFQGNVSEVN
ncbi:MAG: [FeFe] hydrogenase, group A [Candidatus Hydrogenedentes bacterium]|nr:[FeFe] hydrogenase, group A [Candidatus Hydrogenedentota bacterium]